MNIEKTQITKLRLDNINREPYCLDPVEIYLEDYMPGKGKIIITCWGKSWTSFWGAMSGRSIAEFFISCNNQYLANNLSNIDSEIVDYDRIEEQVQKLVDEGHFYVYDPIEIEDKSSFVSFSDRHPEIIKELYGEEWFLGSNIPMKPNTEYQYLCRIIDATRDALTTLVNKEEDYASANG